MTLPFSSLMSASYAPTLFLMKTSRVESSDCPMTTRRGYQVWTPFGRPNGSPAPLTPGREGSASLIAGSGQPQAGAPTWRRTGRAWFPGFWSHISQGSSEAGLSPALPR